MKLKMPSFWQPMSEVKLFTWGYLGFHVFFMVTMRLFLNYDLVIEHWAFWLTIVVAEHALIFGYLGFSRRFIKHQSTGLVIISALLIGAIRTFLTTGAQHIVIPGTNQVPWAYQLLTGALFELLIVTFWANVNGAYRKYAELGRELRRTESSILGYRENAALLLADEQESLVRTTRESLMPQITSIENALSGKAGAVEASAIASELRGFLNNQVRPLTSSLNTAANKLVMPPAVRKSAFWSIVALPPKTRIAQAIYPFTTFVIMSLSFVTAPLWLLNSDWVPFNTALSITYFLVLLAAKRLTSKWPPINSWLVAALLVLIATAAVLPTAAVVLLTHQQSASAFVMCLALLWCSLITICLLAYLNSLDLQASQFLNDLRAENKNLSHEMSLFEQQLWAARRNWSIVLHGTVQAALTAALTRLNSPTVDENDIKLAKQDLQRAADSLFEPVQTQINLGDSISNLQDTWRGVCDVSVEVDPLVLELIAADSRSSMCVNEILKEAVSNAVRHGDATEVAVQIVLNQNEIELQVLNDGRPAISTSRKGLGSTMFDDLTISWQLARDYDADKTVLSARLPFGFSG
jgi:signal transduction histidine kinase